jgi:cytochrome b6-f complex iron-sulfur subunit
MTETVGGCGSCRALPIPEAGIGRRTFLAQGALLAAAAMLAACGASTDTTAPPLSTSTTIKIGDYAALAQVGGIALVTVQGAALAVVRTGASTFVALSRTCPHQGTTVNVSGSGFLCPNHGARFAADGTWVGGQPTGNMQSYATIYDATAGTLTIG